MIEFPHLDPMEEIDQLRAELDVAMVEGQKLQDYSRAKDIKALLEQKTSSLKRLILFNEPFQYTLRRQLHSKVGGSYISMFTDQFTAYVDFDDKSSIIDVDGNILAEFEKNSIFLSDNMFRIYSRPFGASRWEYEFYDSSANKIFELKQDFHKTAGVYENGLVWVSYDFEGNRYTFCKNHLGNTLEVKSIQPTLITNTQKFSENMAVIEYLKNERTKESMTLVINTKGEVVTKGNWKNLRGFSSGVAKYKHSPTLWGKSWYSYINTEGRKPKWANKYPFATSFYDGYAVVYDNGELHLIKKEGDNITRISDVPVAALNQYTRDCYLEEVYEKLLETKRLIRANLDTTEDLIDFDGNILQTAGEFRYLQDGIFAVVRNRQFRGYVDNDGKEIFK